MNFLEQLGCRKCIPHITFAFAIAVLFLDTAYSISDKRLCADENCKKIISLGKGLINYSAGEEGMVSFKTNSAIRIMSKSAGSDPSLWGIEVNGREGFAPKRFIQEEKIYVSEKDLKFEVDVKRNLEHLSPSSLKTSKKDEIIVNSSEETVSRQPQESDAVQPEGKSSLSSFTMSLQPLEASDVQTETRNALENTTISITSDSSLSSDHKQKSIETLSGNSNDYEDIDIEDYEDDEDDVKTQKINPYASPDLKSDFESPQSGPYMKNVREQNKEEKDNEATVHPKNRLVNDTAFLDTTVDVLKKAVVLTEQSLTKPGGQSESEERSKSLDHAVGNAPGINFRNSTIDLLHPDNNIVTVEHKVEEELFPNEEEHNIHPNINVSVRLSTNTSLNADPSEMQIEDLNFATVSQDGDVPMRSLPSKVSKEITSQLVDQADNFKEKVDQSTLFSTKTENSPTNDIYNLEQETSVVEETKPSDKLSVKHSIADSTNSIETQKVSLDIQNLQENKDRYYAELQPEDQEINYTPVPPKYTSDIQLLQSTETAFHSTDGIDDTTYSPTTTKSEGETLNSKKPNTSNDFKHNEPSTDQEEHEPRQPLDTSTEFLREDDSLTTLTEQLQVTETDKKEQKGLFATIMDTVDNILPSSKKHKNIAVVVEDKNKQLDRILFSNFERTQEDTNSCPYTSTNPTQNSETCECALNTSYDFNIEEFLQVLSSKMLEIFDIIAFLAIVGSTSVIFILGYYCFCNSSIEGSLLSKLNQLESSLLACQKENAIVKHNLMSTRQKLASIEDNSFGSNDMVALLKKELEEELLEKGRLHEQIGTLQKELENAADAGIELNKIVSELLSNQTGDESIISSVEDLQKQLNEQQNTILEINASLAEKSRENSELQMMIADNNARYETQLFNLLRDNDELDVEKGSLQSRLQAIREDFDKELTSALDSKNFEIKRLQHEIVGLNEKVDSEHIKWQTSLAKIEALEECLKNLKRDSSINITQVIDVANIKAELLLAQKKFDGLRERWEQEQDARKLAENQLQASTAEVEKIKQDFNQTEKDKLEAQTRLEVLSNYFKEKENQLQKELSLKETMWLKQQGETTTTVDRLSSMQQEIHSLKSQNDALRAEIEAQDAAHKAQIGTLENRAHETWLAARQSDRRCEEARAEATSLRRKLTVLAGINANETNKSNIGSSVLNDDLANAPSPIHIESPRSPLLGRLPPPPFLPPPFMGPPPPFMGMPPPPPFVPPGEVRPAPLGRIMSPPPSQRHIDYEDYLEYEGGNAWYRHQTFSPPPRTYRSLSPADSRYKYGTERDLMSTYDTETDYSPPPSPQGPRRHKSEDNESDKEDKDKSNNAASISSGSENSYISNTKYGSKSKNRGGKFLV